MVDKALFLGNNGERSAMHQLETITNNLANSNTTGFRADYAVVKQYSGGKQAIPSRTYSQIAGTFSDFTPGPIDYTQRDLDVAVSGKGFIAVQSNATGKEGYTRAGNLQVSTSGFLTTNTGNLVMGGSGPIQLGNYQRVDIGTDGTVSVLQKGETLPVTLDRIKLVNPESSTLQKGTDGLFYSSAGAVKQDLSVQVVPGALEGSNVNPVEALTSLIEVSRQFQIHSNFIRNLEDSASKANGILALPT